MHCYQCLLLKVSKDTPNSLRDVSPSNQGSIKAYVLLPSPAIEDHPEITRFFTRHSILVLNNQLSLCPALQQALEHDEVELIEMMVSGPCPRTTPEFGTSSFFPISVETGNVETVRSLFGRDAAVYSGLLFPTYLSPAVDAKNSAILELLLTHRADIKCTTPLAGTLLHLAAQHVDATLLKLLLKCNANANAEMSNKSTPLHLATELERITNMNLLLDGGANINARQKDGSTSLLLATQHSHSEEAASLLLERGADVTIARHDGLTPLHLAAKNIHADLVKGLLEQGAVVNARMTYCFAEGVTPLCFAVDEDRFAYSRPRVVKCLLEFGADVNAACYDGQTILSLAVNSRNLEIVESILKHHPDLTNKANQRILRESVCQDGETSDKIVKLLLEHGCAVDVDYFSDSNFFHNAICKNYFEIVKQLLDRGAEVNKLYCYYDSEKKSSRKTLPLLTAIKFAAENIVQLLVDRGADFNGKLHPGDGSFPIDVAIKAGNTEALKILLASGADFRLYDRWIDKEDIIYFAIERNCLELVEELLKNGIDIHGNSSKLTTPMNHAAATSSIEMIQLLLKNGASVDSRDFTGRTVLHSVSYRDGNVLNLTKFLVQINADIEARCFTNKETPISFAVSRGHLKIVDELLLCGAIIEVENDEGASPLHYAVTAGHTKIFRALLDHSFSKKEIIHKTKICKMFSIAYLESIRNDKELKWLYEKFHRHRERFEKCAEILACHVLKTQAAFSGCHSLGNLVSDNETLMAMLRDDNVLPGWYDDEVLRNNVLSDCEAEIDHMKAQHVGNSIVSFYDVLTGDVKRLSAYARNASIVRTLKSKDYKTKFPIYASVLFYQFRKGTRRKNLLHRAIKMLSSLCRFFHNLPRNLKEEVFNYLSNRELEVLIYACSPTNTDA